MDYIVHVGRSSSLTVWIWLQTFKPDLMAFPCGSAGKESICNAEDLGLIPGSGRSPGEGKGYPLWYSGLENSMDCIVHGVAKSWTWLSNFHLMALVLFQVWKDARNWIKIFFSWKYLNIWGPVLPVFLQHEVLHPGLYPELLSGFIVGHWLQWLLTWLLSNCIVGNILYLSNPSFLVLILTKVWRHLVTGLSQDARNAHSRSGEDSIDRPLNGLFLGYTLLASGPPCLSY